MTIDAKSDAAKAGRVRNAGTSQAVSHNAVENIANVFDGRMYVEPNLIGRPGFFLSYGQNRTRERMYFPTLDDLMTFLADQAIAKLGRASS